MKNKFQLLFILLMIIIVSLPPICFAEQPNPKIWEPLKFNSYYNKKIITKSPDVLLVWTYKTMTDDTRGKRVEEVKKYDLEKSIKYQNYHHETVLWNIDCKNKLILMEEFIDFDKNGKVLDRYRYNNSEWKSILPNSGGEKLYQHVCITQKKPSKKKK
jgi:hypothetical protein